MTDKVERGTPITAEERKKMQLKVFERGALPMFVPQNLQEIDMIAEVGSRAFGQEKRDMIAVLLYGQEMGIPPMQAMQCIYMIPSKSGKRNPYISARLLAAMVWESGKCADMVLTIEGTGEDKVCIAKGKRKDAPSVHTVEVKWAEASRQSNSPVWKQQPDAMLRARATAILCRTVWPEVILGLNVEGEQHFDDRVADEPLTVDIENKAEGSTLQQKSQQTEGESPWGAEVVEKPKPKKPAKKAAKKTSQTDTEITSQEGVEAVESELVDNEPPSELDGWK